MTRKPNYVSIDLRALVHNLGQIRRLTGNGPKIMGIVKSDAYGHGLIAVSRTLVKEGIECLGVAYLHEALELRREGIRSPVVILCGIRAKDEFLEVMAHDLIPVLFDANAVKNLAVEAEGMGKRARIYLKIDTGMGRLGIPYTQVGAFIEEIRSLKNLDVLGLTSHLSSADDPESGFTELQTTRFKEAIKAGRQMGFALPDNNLANSAGIMGHDMTHFDMVRAGIMLYGGNPSPEFSSPIPLEPVMGFKGRVLQIREFPDNTPVSYSRTYHTKGSRLVAILSAGYGDGLPRSMSNRGGVLIKGKRAPIVGTICMNLSACDITGIGNVMAGDEVVFLGGQAQDMITGDDLARWSGSISYEIFCTIGQRNEKEYIS